MHNLTEPVVAADRLQEFGAAYANRNDCTYGGAETHIPHSYWDKLSAAITSTATEFFNEQLFKAMSSKKTTTAASFSKNDNDDNSIRELSVNVSAWSILGQFISNQIRFGYEMEKMLKAELKEFSLNHRNVK
ncbi:unnamed protein product [Thelazia callipaeda]|uniref:Uncharacterized protein n=1 Tax=Thelazia callipaeda TaxID=103827 RepID=A0A0N5CQU0_THECL|nr:unnamed protein product [Thelazia callipaeda]